MQQFLESSQYIDWHHPNVLEKAEQLASGQSDQNAMIVNCFEFVRDEIRHSMDYKMNPVTCKASDVLRYGTGFCYAKSHLLAALLRANDVPTGLCYQRLTIDGSQPPLSLHGLNAVFLEGHGWYRIDPRGNKPGIEAEFCPPVEKLAFPIVLEKEADLPEIWSQPLPIVVNSLETHQTYLDVANNLPDIELLP